MDANKMREQFETAAMAQGLSVARANQALRFANGHSRVAGDYVALETLCAWWAWQASREAVVVELPVHFKTMAGDVMWSADVREALEAQGVKCK